MAKKPGETSGRSNKIKFVLVEADISDGNLSELTQAITSALRPSVVHMRQITRNNNAALPPAGVPDDETEINEQNSVETEEETEEVAAAPKVSKPKKSKQPDYVDELLPPDKMKAFKEFTEQKAPDTKTKKYLVATYWLREHGDSPTVNANKIYTCFRAAGWSTGFSDWGQTFHNLVFSDQLRKAGTTGEFALTTLGEDAVAKGTE
jgi:hypothetical protein